MVVRLIRSIRCRSNSMVHFALALFVVLAALAVPSPASAEYQPPKGVLNPDTVNTWLMNATSQGIEAGAKSVAEKFLTGVGKALVNSYLPEIGNLLFGGGENDELERQVRRILTELQDMHEELSEEHADILNEIVTQYKVDLIATSRAAEQDLIPWFATTDLLTRFNMTDRPCQASKDFNRIRLTIQDYVKSEPRTPDQQWRRLDLLPLHISTAQLAVTANRHCLGTIAIKTAFNKNFGTDYDELENWIASISVGDIDNIESSDPDFSTFSETVYSEAISFYDEISAKTWISEYVEFNLTPPVHHNAIFDQENCRYNSPEDVSSTDCWIFDGSAGTILSDGQRWFYYMDIPRSDCVEGRAFDALIPRRIMPDVEDLDDHSYSNCNRFWILDPRLLSTKWPNTYLGSFDAYSFWFDDPIDIYSLHKELLEGDLIRAIYGPVSLILSRMYAEQFDGDFRPMNTWDLALTKYDEYVGMLGLAATYDDSLSWNDVVSAQRTLATCEITAATVGIEKWYSLLKQYMISQSTDAICTADLEVTHSASANSISLGSSYRYNVTVLNSGPMPASSSNLEISLPIGVEVASEIRPCSEISNGKLKCSLGRIKFGESKQLEIAVTAVENPDSMNRVVLTSTVVVSSSVSDIEISNNVNVTELRMLSYPGTMKNVGWNLISIPLDMRNSDLSVLLSGGADEEFPVILSFEKGALTYDAQLPQFNTLNEIDGLHGYWILNRQPSSFWAVHGDLLDVNTPIELEEGWNLISYLPTESLPVSLALDSVTGKYDKVRGFASYALSYYPHLEPDLNTLQDLQPNSGYWIHMLQPGTLIYPDSLAVSVASADSSSRQHQSRLASSPVVTNRWIDVYGSVNTESGEPVPAGSTVTAVGEDGRMLSTVVVNRSGTIGLMPIYGDDGYTEVLDGAKSSERITFFVNGLPTKINNLDGFTWSRDGDLVYVEMVVTDRGVNRVQDSYVFLPFVQ